MLIRNVDDIYVAIKQGKVGIILGWQNTSPIENGSRRQEVFHRLGVRIIQLTYNERNLLGNGCYERRDDGLSNYGMDAVREMNRLGILIDLSHAGDRTTLEATELSEVGKDTLVENPKGIVHCWYNTSAAPLKFMVIKTPRPTRKTVFMGD